MTASPLSRRGFLKASAATGATLVAAKTLFPSGVFAQATGPEVTGAKLGYIALTDSAPLIMPPLAWLPIGFAAFRDSNPSAIFVIFITAIWPVIINTAVGLRNIPQDYRNVSQVLRLNQIDSRAPCAPARHLGVLR